jgi:hypothetical protein
MGEIIKKDEEVIIIGRSGTRTLMPSLEYAKQRSTGLWKGEVKKIEVTTTYIIADEKLFKKSLEDIEFEIFQLQSDRDNVGDKSVAEFIESKMIALRRELAEAKHSLELINRGK